MIKCGIIALQMSLKNISILAVDDDADMLTALRLLLKAEVRQITTEKNPENIRTHLLEQKYDLLLLDMNFTSALHTGNEGLYWLRKAKSLDPGIQVVMITAYGDIDLAVRSLKDGAADFIVKPWHNEKMLETIKEIVAQKINQQEPLIVRCCSRMFLLLLSLRLCRIFCIRSGKLLLRKPIS
ncbi:response regulator [Niabella hibiscisoli]|uniref:response regulator n=1 Tax=Niabella hibiscisoli TaxID=1825928 RepID=UPI001F0D6FD9|nr:response regulator [Niabella hibiscisoli]MCH5718659.1 response regulator [Niabella hibiscisoli]